MQERRIRWAVTGVRDDGGMDAFRSAKESAKEDVAAKVRKLLAQAEDPAATACEAQSFSAKAQQLMSKYSIDLAMVTDIAHADQLVGRGWAVGNPYARHKVSLINAVARANDCRTVFHDLPDGRKRIDVVGYPDDVEWVQALSRSLEIQLAGALAGALRGRPPNVHGRTFSVAFIQGFIVEVASRLQNARREAAAAAQRSCDEQRRSASRLALEAALSTAEEAAGSVALVLVAKNQRVEEEFKVRHPGTRTVYSQVRLRSWSGYAPGRAAGSRASLARGSIAGSRRSLSA